MRFGLGPAVSEAPRTRHQSHSQRHSAKKMLPPHIFRAVTACRLLSQIGNSALFEVDPTSNVYDKIKVIAGSEIGERRFPAQGRKTTLSGVRFYLGDAKMTPFYTFFIMDTVPASFKTNAV